MPKVRTILSFFSLLSVLGCQAQAAPTYKGEALLTISGSVEVDSTRERGQLAPALAFYNDQDSRLYIMDAEVEGEFPSDFTLRVHQPPPPEAIVESDSRPASALGYISAVAEGHPPSVRYSLSGPVASDCTGPALAAPVDGTSGDPVTMGEVECETFGQWCTGNGDECYTERARCPALDSPPEDCEIIEMSGDPSLREDPWEAFAGLAENYMVVYTEEAWDTGAVPELQVLGIDAIDAGYHLLKTRAATQEEEQEADECADQADVVALERYNDEHGTDYEPEEVFGGFSCAPGQDDCPQPPPEDFYHEVGELSLDATRELGCPPKRFRVRLIDEPEEERISVRIGPDVRPFP